MTGYDYIIVGGKHWYNLHAWLPGCLCVALVLCETAFLILRLQCQEADVDEQSTVSVFWQPGKEFCAREMNMEELGHGDH